VDDDPEVLRAIERDLRSRYANRYPHHARKFRKRRPGHAAGIESAQTIPWRCCSRISACPEMDGVNFLSEAMEMHPLAKRALLTAYADTNAAIDAINEARVHYYLMKPWDPPEEKLLSRSGRFATRLDGDVFARHTKGFASSATRWSNRSYELREFLARNQVPYQWIDVELAQSDGGSCAG